MKPKYCLDTSGFSSPLMDQPEIVYVKLWTTVRELVSQGIFCWNTEISEEMTGIYGQTGDEIRNSNRNCCFEVGQDKWNWQEYLIVVEDWRVKYHNYISEYNGSRKNTIGLNDLSIVAMAKVVALPLISMEKRNLHGNSSTTKMRIPDLCDREGIKHLSFLSLIKDWKTRYYFILNTVN